MTCLSWPYVPGPSGWGEATRKQADFCELHFYTGPYIAEFINTLSNLAYVMLGFWGARNALDNKRSRVVWLSYVSLAGVGIGSAAYHTTVKYEGQLADEIAMLYATATILYSAVSIVVQPRAQLTAACMFGYFVCFVTAVHIYRGTSTFFQICWASMVIAVFVQCKWLITAKVPSGTARSEMRKLALCGTVYFLGGFALWNVDNIFCEQLRAVRAFVGMPLGFLFELHGWWHIFTGIGSYYFIVLIEYLRVCVPALGDRQVLPVRLVWPHTLSLPYMRALKSLKEN